MSRHRSALASAFTRAGSPRVGIAPVRAVPGNRGAPSGAMIALRPPNCRIFRGTTTVTAVIPPYESRRAGTSDPAPNQRMLSSFNVISAGASLTIFHQHGLMLSDCHMTHWPADSLRLRD